LSRTEAPVPRPASISNFSLLLLSFWMTTLLEKTHVKGRQLSTIFLNCDRPACINSKKASKKRSISVICDIADTGRWVAAGFEGNVTQAYLSVSRKSEEKD
jgi:hypothetical protein